MNKRLLWLIVPAIGLAELGAHAYFSKRAPTEAEWDALRPVVAELRQNQELVVAAPAWGGPLLRHALGDELMPLDQVARPDATAFARAIEVSAMGARSDELADWRVVSEKRSGDFVLRVLENPAPAKVTYSFVDQLPRAEVFAGARPCNWTTTARVTAGGLGGTPTLPAERFECTGGAVVGVSVIDDEDFRPRRCIWAPPASVGPLVLRYRNVPLGERIRGYTGMPWLLTRDGAGPPIELAVRVGEASIGTAVQPETGTWTAFDFALGEHAGKTADVDFEIRSSSAQNRMFCFHGDTRNLR